MNQLSLAGTKLEHFHICAFFNSRNEEYEVLAPFFLEGIEQGEKLVQVVNPNNAEDHLSRLNQSGVDTHHCTNCGQLEVLFWEQAYLDEQGAFQKEKMLETVDEMARDSLEQGYPRLRIMGDMDWAFRGPSSEIDLLEYESAVNDVLARNRQPAVCVYDIAKLSGGLIMDLLRTHPLTLIGGVVQENPFYTPPAQMLKELKARYA